MLTYKFVYKARFLALELKDVGMAARENKVMYNKSYFTKLSHTASTLQFQANRFKL